MATIAEILYLFRDGQAAKTIGPTSFQTMIIQLHLASGSFQDLPTSPAGLANGRLWLNGDIIQMSVGSMPASPLGNFLGTGAGRLVATVSFARKAARSTVAGSGSLFADPQPVTPSQRDFSVDFSIDFH